MVKRTITISLFIVIVNLQSRAQSENITNREITNYNNVPELSGTRSNQLDDKQSQAIEKCYREYRWWFIKYVYPLSKEAELSGIQATQGEISDQEKAFEAMFPGTPCIRNELCNEILARKYSITIQGAFISPSIIKNAYTQLQSEFSNESMPSLADVQPILELMALLENRSVQIEAEKYSEQEQKKYNDTLIKSSEMWPISDLMIHAPDNYCLAQYTDNDSCLLTVEQFNKYIRFMEISKLYSIDPARIKAINEIIRDLYIANVARNQIKEVSDSIAQLKHNWIKCRIFGMEFNKVGIPVSDSNSLRDAYFTYYDALFRERISPCFSIIGSSDSLYMESISQVLKSDTSKNNLNNNNKSNTINFISNLPWSYSLADFLPEEFDKYTDTMHIKGVSKIIKMPYGFFIIRLDNIQKRAALRFEDVQEDLILLATKRKWQNLDSLLEAEAYRIYTSNNRLNKKPDTLRVMAYLKPVNHWISNSAGFMTNAINQTPEFREKGLNIVSTQLPFDIRDSLLNRFEANKDKKQLLGPITSRYGVWNFKVLEINRGKGFLPFTFSKKRLIDCLAIRELEFNLNAPWQKPDSILDNLALAESYTPVFFGNHNAGKEEMNDAQSRSAELTTWLSKLSILYDTDHQGGVSISSGK